MYVSLQKEEDCLTSLATENVPQEKSEVVLHLKSWANCSAPVTENQCTEASKVKLGLKTYCPQCRVDSQSEQSALMLQLSKLI